MASYRSDTCHQTTAGTREFRIRGIGYPARMHSSSIHLPLALLQACPQRHRRARERFSNAAEIHRAGSRDNHGCRLCKFWWSCLRRRCASYRFIIRWQFRGRRRGHDAALATQNARPQRPAALSGSRACAGRVLREWPSPRSDCGLVLAIRPHRSACNVSGKGGCSQPTFIGWHSGARVSGNWPTLSTHSRGANLYVCNVLISYGRTTGKQQVNLLVVTSTAC